MRKEQSALAQIIDGKGEGLLSGAHSNEGPIERVRVRIRHRLEFEEETAARKLLGRIYRAVECLQLYLVALWLLPLQPSGCVVQNRIGKGLNALDFRKR